MPDRRQLSVARFAGGLCAGNACGTRRMGGVCVRWMRGCWRMPAFPLPHPKPTPKPSPPASALPPPPPADLPYRGNTFDLASLIAGILGITTLASCTGLAYCLPFVAGIIGLYAFLNAEQSTNPKRTRMVAGIGIAAAALMLFFLVLIVLFMLFGIAMSFISSSP